MRILGTVALLALAGCSAESCHGAISVVETPIAEARPGRHRAGGSGGGGGSGGAADVSLAMNIALAVECYGQSNCLVSTATPLQITSRPAHASRTYAWNNTTLLNLLENNVNTGSVESPASGFGHALTNFEGTRSGTISRRLWVDVGAVAAQSCAQLSSGTANYNNMVTEYGEAINAAQAAWTALGNGATTSIRPIVIWIQGEQDNNAGTAEATYISCLRTLRSDLQTSLNALEGTSWTIPFFISQLANWTHTSVGLSGTSAEATVANFQYRLCRDYPDEFICSHPTHFLGWQANQHLSAVGSDWNGEYFSKPVLSYLTNGGAVTASQQRALRPVDGSITCDGTTITIPFQGGYDSTDLTFDTTNVLRKEQGGFAVHCPSQATNPVVTGTAASGRTVTLTLNRSCTSDCLVRYMHWAVPRVTSPGPTTAGAPGGNLRSTTTTDLYVAAGTDSRDWSLGFEENLDSCTNCAEAAETTYVADQGSFRADNSPLGYISCAANSTQLSSLNGSANVSFSFWVRHTSWPQSLTSIVARSVGGNTQFGFRSTAAVARGLRWFISSGTNDTSNYGETPANTMTSAGWDHVCGVYDGTQATNALKMVLYVNGSAVALNFTGTIPTTFSSPANMDLALGADSGGGGNAHDWSVQDLAIWPATSLTAATDCPDLYNAGQPANVLGDLSTDPTVFIPAHTNLEVQGTAASLYCQRVGAGVTRQASAP